MLYALLEKLIDLTPDLQILRYITVRATFAAVTAFLFCLVFGPWIIRILGSLGLREDTQKSDSAALNRLHADKKHTPTMGGLIYLTALMGSVALWGRLDNPHILLVLVVTTALGLLGFVDDYIKLASREAGLRARTKLAWQGLIALIAGVILMGTLQVKMPGPAQEPGTKVEARLDVSPLAVGVESAPRYAVRDDSGAATSLFIPFVKGARIPLGVLFLGLVVLVVTGSSNAVNLTDGLDGLASGTLILVSATFALVAYIVGRADFAGYLLLPYVPGAGELSVFCAAMMGAGMGFLWHNCHPASVFLGDTGSLPLGGALGMVSVVLKQEALLLVAGGIFALEAISVMLQVASFKLTGKRIFRIAPLHHHFQFGGLPESKVTVRFWIIGAILALLSLITLKVR